MLHVMKQTASLAFMLPVHVLHIQTLYSAAHVWALTTTQFALMWGSLDLYLLLLC